MAERIPGVLLDGSEGSMIELAESLSLERFIDRHNDPDDRYHLQPHEVVCCAYRRVAMPVFGPCMVKYVGDLSEAHAVRLRDPESGALKFPSLPNISRKLWRRVQDFDISRLILSEMEGSLANRDQWEHEMNWFHPLEDDLQCEELPSVTSSLKLYHDGGRKIGLARRDVLGVLMPTQSLLEHMRKKYKLEAFTQENINRLQDRLAPLRAMYVELFNHTQRFFVTYPDSDSKLVLKVMESFDRCAYCFSLPLCTWIDGC